VRGDERPDVLAGPAVQPAGADARDLGRLRVPRPARDRRARPPPAREAGGQARSAGADHDGAGSRLPVGALRLRARLVAALFLTAAASLAVAALALLPPLQARLRGDAARTLQLHAEAARGEFEEGHAQRVVRD